MSVELLGRPRAVVFDFDGVLLESTALKEEAFRHVFADVPEHLPAIVAHHRRHLGRSRFEKFQAIHDEVLRTPLSPLRRQQLGDSFERFVARRIVDCPEVEGASACLRALFEAEVSLYVASGTPHEELLNIVRSRSWEPYFQGVWGSPHDKADILRRVARKHRLAPQDVVLVGDGGSDYEAAREVGAQFVLRETPTQQEFFAGEDLSRVRDLKEFASALAPPGDEDAAVSRPS